MWHLRLFRRWWMWTNRSCNDIATPSSIAWRHGYLFRDLTPTWSNVALSLDPGCFFLLGGGLSSIHRLGHLSLNLSVSCHDTSIFLHAGKWFVVCLFLIHAFGTIDFMLLHSTSGSRHFHPEAGAGCDLCPGGRSQHQEYDEGRGHPTKIRWNVWIKKGNRMWLRFLGLIFF